MELITTQSKNDSCQNKTIKPYYSSWLDSWIDYLDVKPSSIKTYTIAIQQFLKFLQHNSIVKPTRQDIYNYRDELLAKGLKASTIVSYLQSVKAFFEWLNTEHLYENIAERVKAPRVSYKHGFHKDYLTSKQVKQLLRSIKKDTAIGRRDFALCLLLVTTGLRTIEASRANIEDLKVVGSFTALFIQGKGRDDKNEMVLIPELLEKALKESITDRLKVKESDPIFCSLASNCKGHRLSNSSISRIIKTRLRSIGLNSTRLTAHSLRHTAATLNLLAGGTIAETQQLLRHSNINTTMIYSHALERAKNRSEERILKKIGL